MQTPEEMKIRRNTFLEKGFELFSEKSIESVTLQDVAKASGAGVATLYRYFSSKPGFLVEMAAWKWDGFFEQNRRRRPLEGFEGKTAADMFEFYLDSFLEVYRNHRPLLRFNQMFNVYLRSEEIDSSHVIMYRALMKPIADFFHVMYQKALADKTLRTDLPEEQMLSITMHLMLAVVTRYAVGLVYEPEGIFDAEKELEIQKEMLLQRYKA